MIIYGAQGIALGAFNAIKILHPEKKIECFLVTEMGNNSSTLGGIPVRELNEFVSRKTEEEKKNIEVLIATPENVMEAIENSLDEVGICNHTRLISTKWAELQEQAFSQNGLFTPLSKYPVGDKVAEIEIYKTMHQKDKPLKSGDKCPNYLIPIQVGTAYSDNVIADITDDKGDNISQRNGNYSELTGLYWIWKNSMKTKESPLDNSKYYGLSHYRRYLSLTQNDQNRLAANNIDVVLPYPMPYEPNIEVHHGRYLSEGEWSCVLQAIEELQPEYRNGFQHVLDQNYMYNYNIFLAKQEVFDDYCSWLFPLLFRIEELNDPDGKKIPNRYIGYIGETLETVYFMYNKDKLKIAHTGCIFLT